MTIGAGSTYFLTFTFLSEGDKLSSIILIVFRENNVDWKGKEKKNLPTN